MIMATVDLFIYRSIFLIDLNLMGGGSPLRDSDRPNATFSATRVETAQPRIMPSAAKNGAVLKCVVVGDGAVGKVCPLTGWDLGFADSVDLFIDFLCEG
jgi:hypothetical protein